ncbi:MAG: type II toxin-antitoxin system VapC family toxin [bacterium]|nr:type II toxin-antitoxin system VapC family toxin [bacterium]
MRSVDTNVLVRLITRDDAEQARAAEEFARPGGWISHLVLAETTWVLSSVYELKPAAIARAVEMLLNHQHLSVQGRSTVVAALEHFKKSPALGLSDCLVLEIARKAGHLPLGTFDRRLSALPGAHRLEAIPPSPSTSPAGTATR